MAERVGVRRFQHRPAIAVDDDRGAGRGIFLGMSSVPMHACRRIVTFVGDVDVGDVDAMMMPCVGGVAGDDESRCGGGETHSAAAKPPTGFGTEPGH